MASATPTVERTPSPSPTSDLTRRDPLADAYANREHDPVSDGPCHAYGYSHALTHARVQAVAAQLQL